MAPTWNDTIVALATPPGIGAIGVIRVSGPRAVEIVDALFPAKDLLRQASHTLHVGIMEEEGKALDEVVISLYRKPRSYTGEEVVEISGHGSPFVLQQLVEAIIRKGARLAKPGEFTQRAFLNGKLDLAQAEAVADLIASNSSAAQRTALNNMRGGFSKALKGLREELLTFSALIELELDFSQEDVEFADRSKLNELVKSLSRTTSQLVESFRLGNVIRQGVSVAIIGAPNAGKSTLLNTLLNENRAIVSEIAGTTRDTIEELLNINGIIFRLIDTAGIREHTSDLIESIGMERSLEKMQEADLVIYLFDVNETGREELEKLRQEFREKQLKYLLVGNKIDRMGEEAAREKFKGNELVFISAREQLHTTELMEALVHQVLRGSLDTESTIVTNARHYQALLEVQRSLAEIERGLKENLPGDLLALDIRRCLHWLGEITGEISNEDQLDYIFSKFCIGK